MRCKSIYIILTVTVFSMWGTNCLPVMMVSRLSADDETRYSIAEFIGDSEFPHSNQAIFGEDGRQRSPYKDGGVSRASSYYLLVADRQSNELFLYSKIPLWRLDTGGVDEEVESLWHQTASKVTYINSLSGYTEKKDSAGHMWSAMSKAIFIDLLQFSPNSPLTEQVAQVHKQVRSIDFGESGNNTSGTVLLQRIVPSDGNRIVINNSVSGQLLTALSAERNSQNANQLQCKSVIYMADKPMEILSGVLTLRASIELPESVAKMIKLSQIPQSPRDQHPPEPSDIADSAPNRDATDVSAERQSNRNIIMLVIGSITVFLVFVFRSFHSLREKSNE